MADSNNTNSKSSSTASSNIDLQKTFDIAIDNNSEIDSFIKKKIKRVIFFRLYWNIWTWV